MPRTTLAALALLLSLSPAVASIVPREQVTLGVLSDSADAIVIATVERLGPNLVHLSVDDTLKGPRVASWDLPTDGEVGFTPEQRVLVWLDLGLDGTPRPLRNHHERILLTSDDHAAALRAAILRRLPTLDASTHSLRDDLFAQLTSPYPRIRHDAAYDLLAFRELEVSPTDVELLSASLELDPALPTLQLVARHPHPALLGPVLHQARTTTDPLRFELAATAAGACDPLMALEYLAEDLAESSPRALTILGFLPHPAATETLLGALTHTSTDVRHAAIRALSQAVALDPQPLVDHALTTTDPKDVRLALAALARQGAGSALATCQEELTDEALVDLAQHLRTHPEDALSILGN